mmetsp:Transcript_13753/g.50076  ORF Transcript_13753/g.50076 Transcript_13753/m.50076 type:complete len:175 (-) Transcript_13753:1709-2233(-)
MSSRLGKRKASKAKLVEGEVDDPTNDYPFLPEELPFKVSQYSERYPKGRKPVYWKQLKQILAAEMRQQDTEESAADGRDGKSSLSKSRSRNNSTVNLMSAANADHQLRYLAMQAPPSAYPAKKYCDLTGFEAPYTEPKSKIRYAAADLYPNVRALPEQQVKALLALRNVESGLR